MTRWPLIGCLTLAACCTGGFELSEQGRAVVSAHTSRDADVELDYSCSLPGPLVELLDRACLVLEDRQRHVVTLQGRYDVAVTDDEKERLLEMRDAGLDQLYSDLSQLHLLVQHEENPSPGGETVIVYRAPEPVEGVAPVDTSSLDVRFHHVEVSQPGARPGGVVVRGASRTHVLQALLDDMVQRATADKALSGETREALAD